MRKHISTLGLVALFAALLWVLPAREPADAGVACSVPFNLTNGTTADASQVMANYNAILNCLANNTAASGANSDITSLSGLTTPLSPAQGGSSYFIGGTTGGTNTYTLANPTPNGYVLTSGYVITLTIGATNTGAATLNVNGLGAKNIFKQTLNGPVALTGGELVSGTMVAAYYDGTQYEVITPIQPVTIANISTSLPPYGIDYPINAMIVSSVGSNLLTVNLKAADTGNDPSTLDPVLIPFRSTTAGTGNITWVPVTSALSINTNATGATLACQNGIPCRFWVEVFCNAAPCTSGSAVSLAIWQSGSASATIAVNPLDDSRLLSTTAISGGATSAGVFYTPNGVTLTNEPFRILGFVETTEATAGTYASAPTKVQNFGPGVHKPGDVVQTAYGTTTTAFTVNTTTFAQTNLSATITPTSAINLVSVRADAVATSTAGGDGTGEGPFFQISRGSGPTLVGSLGGGANYIVGTSASFGSLQINNFVLDNPQTTSSTTYFVYGRKNVATNAWHYPGTDNSVPSAPAVIFIQEIMGSLEPANDNSTPLSMVG